MENKFNLNTKIFNYLIDNGFDSFEKMNDFLYPKVENISPIANYKSLPNIKTALEKHKNSKVLIYGDYDCDGICATTILYLYLKEEKYNVNYYLPNRISDGYGLSVKTIDKLVEKFDFDLLITVDCGISNYKEVEYIKSIGKDVIVTDHHNLPPKLPDCLIFNPKCDNGFKDLCGAGVALRLIEYLSSFERAMDYIEIAMIATIGDLVPLVKDNRLIVKLGLEKLKNTKYLGLKKLLAKSKANADSEDIAFKICPRLNALGRLEDANEIIELFTSDDNFITQTLVDNVDSINEKRKDLTNQTYLSAIEKLKDYDLINNKIIVLCDKEWNLGILGIVSARITKEFNRPSILMSESGDKIKGSGRSIDTINIYNILNKFSEKFVAFGGHAKALGLTISKDYFDEFIKDINSIDFDDADFKPAKQKYINLEKDDIVDVCKSMELLKPFGNANPKPKTIIKNINYFYKLGTTNHLKCNVSNDFEIVSFNSRPNLEILNSNIDKYLKLNLSFNNYSNKYQGIVNNTAYDIMNKESDIISSQFIKQKLYSNNELHEKVKFIKLKDLENYSKNLYGTLFIASSMISCYNVNKLYNIDVFDIYYKTKLNPYTQIILAPKEFSVAKYYKNIVFIDRPLSNNYINRFISDNIENVFVVEDNDNFNIKFNDENIMIVLDLIKNTNKYEVKSLYELYLSCKTMISYFDFSLSFYILYELKIIDIQPSFKIIINERKIDLSKSAIYRSFNEQGRKKLHRKN